MDYQPDQEFALRLDAADPLKRFRDNFHLPRRPDGSPLVYLCGHSLGPQPKAARDLVDQELDAWSRLGVEGHFEGSTPWYSYHEQFRDFGGKLVGARSGEVVMMNSLTVNFHLMLASFYRPTAVRTRILVEEPTFPSDLYALESALRLRGIDPSTEILHVRPRAGEHCISEEHIEQVLEDQRRRIALVFLSGVNYVTGQWFDIGRLSAAAHRHDAIAGWSLVHAAGNVPLSLHDWNVDFAVWCNYKYLCGGPGAVGGCFVHEKHGANLELPRLGGWRGTDPATRFEMDREPMFVPQQGAEGWQISNPPILAMAPLRASLALFDEAGMPELREKSVMLTGYLEYLLDHWLAGRVDIITPRQPQQRGCALSIALPGDARAVQDQLLGRGIVCDVRSPNILRAAPLPLYNTFHDVWTFAHALAEIVGGGGWVARPERA